MTPEQKEFRQHYQCFARNGRWGTCVDCPRDTNDQPYPEFCENSYRYDHHLDAHQLAEQWERRK
jgi:hypothetical protein